MHFLEERGTVSPDHLGATAKATSVGTAGYNPICAGLFEIDRFYSSEVTYPVYVDPEPIRKKILCGP